MTQIAKSTSLMLGSSAVPTLHSILGNNSAASASLFTNSSATVSSIGDGSTPTIFALPCLTKSAGNLRASCLVKLPLPQPISAITISCFPLIALGTIMSNQELMSARYCGSFPRASSPFASKRTVSSGVVVMTDHGSGGRVAGALFDIINSLIAAMRLELRGSLRLNRECGGWLDAR